MDIEFLNKYLKMEAIQEGAQQVMRCMKRYVYKNDEERFIPFDEQCVKIFNYALEHWDETMKEIRYWSRVSGHERRYVGYWIDGSKKGVSAEYDVKNIKILVTWTDIKNFIAKMLDPSMEDRQMTMLELMIEEVR